MNIQSVSIITKPRLAEAVRIAEELVDWFRERGSRRLSKTVSPTKLTGPMPP